jgi:glycosyltransferase involved in cell wall biosynthesis
MVSARPDVVACFDNAEPPEVPLYGFQGDVHDILTAGDGDGGVGASRAGWGPGATNTVNVEVLDGKERVLESYSFRVVNCYDRYKRLLRDRLFHGGDGGDVGGDDDNNDNDDGSNYNYNKVMLFLPLPHLHHHTNSSLRLNFHIVALPQAPPGTVPVQDVQDDLSLVIKSSNGETFVTDLPQIAAGTPVREAMTLTSVEPGSHALECTVVSRRGGKVVVVSDVVEVLFDRLLSGEEGGREGGGRSMIAVGGEAPEAPEAPQGPEAPQALKAMYVGMLKMDGQKTIWLHLLKHMPSNPQVSNVTSTFVTFLDLGKQINPDYMMRELEAVGVDVVIEPLPGVSVSALSDIDDFDMSELYDGNNKVNMEYVVHYLHQQLYSVGSDVSSLKKLKHKWIYDTWSTIINTVDSYNPDILIFANSRDVTDLLLLTACNISQSRPAIVMDLPNLYPKVHKHMIDTIVGPSHYAAHHHSVEQFVSWESDGSDGSDGSGGSDDSDGRDDSVSDGKKKTDVVVIPPGVDVSLWNRERISNNSGDDDSDDDNKCYDVCGCNNLNPSCHTVGFIGRISTEKSPNIFVQVAEKILSLKPFTKFIVIGDGDFIQHMILTTHILGIHKAFVFKGALHGDELIKTVATVDVILNTPMRYDAETFCIANLEAMALSIPVVTFGIGGIGEYAVDGVNSIVVYSEEGINPVNAMADAAVRLLEDDGLRERMGQEGRKTAERFNVERMVGGYQRLFGKLAKERRARIEVEGN